MGNVYERLACFVVLALSALLVAIGFSGLTLYTPGAMGWVLSVLLVGASGISFIAVVVLVVLEKRALAQELAEEGERNE